MLTEPTTKRFPTLAVAGAYTGMLLAEGKPDDWRAYAAMVELALGPTLPVTGPMHVSREAIDRAYDAMRERVSK
jgi:hypothetical protein